MAEIASPPTGEIEIDVGDNVMIGHTGHKLGQAKDLLFDDTELIGVVLEPRFLQEACRPTAGKPRW
jgi:hypothetical protein